MAMHKKETKILTLKDGRPRVLHNGTYFFAEAAEREAAVLDAYLEDGWTFKAVLSCYEPAFQKEGAYTFYMGGHTYLLERDKAPEETAKPDPEEAYRMECERIRSIIESQNAEAEVVCDDDKDDDYDYDDCDDDHFTLDEDDDLDLEELWSSFKDCDQDALTDDGD